MKTSRFPLISVVSMVKAKILPSTMVSRFPSVTASIPKGIVSPKWEKNVTCRYCGYDGEGYSSHQVFGCRC